MLLFYDSSFNIIPTVGIEKTNNNIDGTINNLDDGYGDVAIKKLIDYTNYTKWYGGHDDYSLANGTMKIKLWRQPVYYRFVTGDDNDVDIRIITSWTMYDHTLNKISNEYFYNDEYYVDIVQNYHYYPVDSSGNSSGYFDFNDNEFIDDIYDCDLNSSDPISSIQDSDSSFLVGRVYQLINLTGSAESALAKGDNNSGFGSNDWFGPAVYKAGIIASGSVGTAYIKIFANVTTENNGTPTTYSKGFKFITNATFKSFDMTKVAFNNYTLYYQQPKGKHRQALINNTIYRIDNITASYSSYSLCGDNDYGYSMAVTKLTTAAIHSGVLADSET